MSASWLIPDFPDFPGIISAHDRRENERLWFEDSTRLYHALIGGFYDPPSLMTGQARFDMEMREIRRQHDEMRRQLREMHKHFPEQVAQGGGEKMLKCPKDCICPKCLDARRPAPESGKAVAAQPLPPGVHLAARQRVGDEQRGIFLDRLRGAYEDGYIDLTEFGARQDAAMKAVTEDELKLLVADLPEMKAKKIPEVSRESSAVARWFHSPGLYLACLLANICCAVFTIFFLLPTLAGQILLPFSSGLAAICTVHLLRPLYKKGMTDPGR